MGVYLSAPVTDKHSIDKTCKICTYGASSMQGWRLSQEDAHNCIPEFDKNQDSAFFAVYDGHGGAEVAQYCAMHLPDFIQTMPEYQEGKYGDALQSAFLKFDATLTEESVVKELRRLAGTQAEEEDPDVERHEAEMLRAEADMPLEELLSNYDQGSDPPTANSQSRRQFLSPVIRTKPPMFPMEGGGAEDLGDGCSKTTGGSNLSRSTNSSTQDPGVAGERLEDKLINGHADNDNNLNLEREIKGTLEGGSGQGEGSQIPDTSVDSSVSREGKGAGAGGGDDGSSAEAACEVTDSSCVKKSSRPGLTEVEDVSSTTDSLPMEADGGSSKSDGSLEGDAASSTSGHKASEMASSSADVSKGKSRRVKVQVCQDGEEASDEDSSSGVRESFARALDKDNMDDEDDDSDDSNWENAPDDDDDDDDEDNEDEDEEEDDDDDMEDIEDEEEDDEDDENDAHMMASEDDVAMDMSSEEPGSGSGCTACVAVIIGKKLVVANAGDSRCVLCRNGQAVDLSFDHKPEDEPEKERIEKAGGKVTADGRVNGGLNLSRAIGDHVYKLNTDLPDREQMITALPDIRTVTLTEADEFMVLACDGIWNYMTSEQVVKFVKERREIPEKRKKLSKICEEMFDYCLAPNTFGDGTGCDNMTCIIVDLTQTKGNCNSVGDNKRGPELEVLPSNSAEKRRKIDDSQELNASSTSQAACSSSASSSSASQSS